MPLKRVTFHYYTLPVPTRAESVRQLTVSLLTVVVILAIVFGFRLMGNDAPNWQNKNLWLTAGVLAVVGLTVAGYYIVLFSKERRRSREAMLHPTSGDAQPALTLTDAGINWYRQGERRATLIAWSEVSNIELLPLVNKTDPVRITYTQADGQHTLQFVNGQLDWQTLNVYNTLRRHWAHATAAANGPADAADGLTDTAEGPQPAQRRRPTATDTVYRYKTTRLLTQFLVPLVFLPVAYFISSGRAAAGNHQTAVIVIGAVLIVVSTLTALELFNRLRANNRSLPPLVVSSRGLAVRLESSGVPPLLLWRDIMDIELTDNTHVRIDYDADPDGIVRSVVIDTSAYVDGATIYYTLTDTWQSAL